MKTGAKAGAFNVLNEEELSRIHESSLTLLKDPGIYCESKSILSIFHNSGAHVDHESRMIQVPGEMVESALAAVPKSFILHGRDPEMSMDVRQGRVYHGMGGTSEPNFWDYDTGQPRTPTKDDMALNTRVAEALPNIDFVMTLCSARDMPAWQVFLHDYDAIFRNTTKPVVFSILEPDHTRMVLEMASAASGGMQEFRRAPWLMGYVTPRSPLTIGKVNEGILVAAEWGVPILYGVGPMMGATGPATVAGILAQANAEVLFGLVLSQLIHPGIPFVHSPHTPAMDMQTAQCTYGSAEQALGRMGAAQLARRYNLPSFNSGGGVEAKLPDSQAAAEAMMGMLLNGLSGVTLTQSLGTLASGLYGSAEMLVICDEIVHMIKHILGGISVSDETLAIDVIRDAGPGGQFLDKDHTARHFRDELFFPILFRRQSIEQWIETGARRIEEVAHEKVQSILAEAAQPCLSSSASEDLDMALQDAIHRLERKVY